MNYINLLYVAAGGALGAAGRYLITYWFYSHSETSYPLGTFTVNIVGCFLLGLIYKLTMEKSLLSPELRLMLTVGMIGAFTTFSTFSFEILNLIKENNFGTALLYIGASVFCGLLAVWLGAAAAGVFDKLTLGGGLFDQK
jgi:CrcB protein